MLLPLDDDLGATADEEQDLFGFIVGVIGIMLPTSVMFMPMETFLTPPNFGAKSSFDVRGGFRNSPWTSALYNGKLTHTFIISILFH